MVVGAYGVQPVRVALDALNFLAAAIETGFGPFLTVFLTRGGWRQTDIGLVLSIGTIAALAGQVPGGALVDAIHRKRIAVATGLALTGLAALMLAVWPSFPPVAVAQVLHAGAATMITPGIAALTLRVAGHAGFSGQLGSNTRWASLGSAGAAGLFGAVASALSERAVFLSAAALTVPALVTLLKIAPRGRADGEPDHPALLHPAERKRRHFRPWRTFTHLHLHSFAICMAMFSLSNAAMLPFALNALAARGRGTGLIVSAALIVSQLVAALISPWFGRIAQSRGRRPLLLVGFAALPIRGAVLALLPGAATLIGIEILDGVSAAVIGIMLPLIAADLTRRTGFLNLAIGSFGLASGLGATVSTFAAGWVADHAGTRAALLGLAAVGAVSVALVAMIMPETRPTRRSGAVAPD